MKPGEVGLLAPREEVVARVDELAKEITRGWIIYGKYIDTKKTDLIPAKEVLKIIRRMEAEKAELEFILDPNKAAQYLFDHASYLDEVT